MSKGLTTFLLFIFFTTSVTYAQTLKVDCSNKPLNELLIEWRNEYNLQFSFNDQLLSQHRISLTQVFNSPIEALKVILKDLPFECELNNGVYLIFPRQIIIPAKTYHLIGKIIESGTNEPLPFSHVSANNFQTITDIKGVFSFTSQSDSIFQIKASHLGCYIVDTILIAGHNHQIELKPSLVGLPEVTVTNNIVETAAQIGESSGLTKLNHNIANYLPGNGDNSVFNLLRLQPGILAAGEQPNDLIIWGSPEGTSRVLFDGFTIWGLKNFNDDISAVNPYLAQNVEVQKGGYDASNNDLIGGIVNIIGKKGNRHQPNFNFFINNQTLNTMLEFPIKKKSSLMLAYRQTYYNLFRASDVNTLRNNNQDNEFPIEVQTPEYDFRDANLKYSFQGDNKDLFYISLFAAGDDFSFDAIQTRPKSQIIQSWKEESEQIGGTFFYSKTWNKGHSSDLKLTFSRLNSNFQQRVVANINRYDTSITRRDVDSKNNVSELNAEWKNKFLLNEQHSLNTGFALTQNSVTLSEDTFNIKYIDIDSRINRLTFFIQDEFQLNKSISLKGGLRFNYPTHMQKGYIDPRLSISVRASGRIKLNASWGKYHQFLVKSSVVDNDNYRYSWTVAGYNEVPVMESEHWVVGAAYFKHKFLFSIDGFHKKNKGLTRFIRYKKEDYIFQGTSQSYGLDFYAKQDFKGHSIWAGYGLSKTEELFPYFRDQEYRRSPQDQRHEFKTATLINLGAFHFSVSYIYGSGFPIYEKPFSPGDFSYVEPDYNRTDVSLIYKLSKEKFTGEIGLSVLNLFDSDNVKFSNFERVPFYQLSTVYLNSDAVPFTPLLYLKAKL